MSSVKENAFLLNQVTPFDLDILLYFWRTNYLVMRLEEVQAKKQKKRLSEMLSMERLLTQQAWELCPMAPDSRYH